MNPVIHVENLGKRYFLGQSAEKIGNYRTLRDSFSESFKRLKDRTLRAGSTPNSEEFWALRDVSFQVNEGEHLGIIGCNGAGKSTLLKIISRITQPTNGRIRIKGRVASLLEVGTGFHPELTGRENIYLNGAILGMSRVEIRRKFDEIVAFSEIERFLDTPVKRYSSGMYVRLAFAVAAHLEPEVLVVDEVLAVGDAAFQKKCLGKMGEVAQEGRTVLFVSHNMIAVQSLCRKAIWLDAGQVAAGGDAGEVVSRYIRTASTSRTDQVWTELASAPGNDRIRLNRACVRPENGCPDDSITVRTPFRIEFDYWNLDPGSYLNLSLHIYNAQGILVFNPAPVNEPVWNGRPFPAGLFRSACLVPGDLMNDGMHRVELLVVKDEGTVIFRYPDILAFEVQDDTQMRGAWHGKIPGAVRPNLQWQTELLKEEISNVNGGLNNVSLSGI